MKRKSDIHKQLQKTLDHFAHILPGQASIRDFVHHNTLHGFEHLKFQDALKAAHELTGAYGYWTQDKFREQYLKGRIKDVDIDTVLQADESLNADEVLFSLSAKNKEKRVYLQDLYRVALLYPLKKITACQLKWKIEESNALSACQSDISSDSKQRLLEADNSGNKDEAQIVRDLWEACVEVLGLDDSLAHPEQMKELSPEQAEKMMASLSLAEEQDNSHLSKEEKKALAQQQQAWDELNALTQDYENGFTATHSSANVSANASLSSLTTPSKLNLRNLIKTLTGVDISSRVIKHSQSKIDPLIRNESWKNQNALFAQVGDELTLRGLLKKLTNFDIQEEIVPSLQRFIANWLDEGFAAWGSSDKSFYHHWKQTASKDQAWLFNDMPEWQEYIDSLPDNSSDAVTAELTRMDIPEEKWSGYLDRLALELPGWSGMFYWRHTHPNYEISTVEGADKHADMMDYLAVRLVLEHLHVRRFCAKFWRNEGNLSSLRGYFHRHHAEFTVRNSLFNQHMPEYLIGLSQQLIKKHASHAHTDSEWHVLAHMIWTWQQCPSILEAQPLQAAEKPQHANAKHKQNEYQHAHHSGWILFRIAQHLGMDANDLRSLKDGEIDKIFDCFEAVSNPDLSGFLMLQAYEHHYREEVFSVISQNHGRGTWADRKSDRPEAQVVFCMDDREEGFRRHLEHHNPAIETLGAAAFFGVVMDWKSLDVDKPVTLCPVVLTPVHKVEEVVAPDEEERLEKHQSRYRFRTRLRDLIHQETQRNLLSSSFLMALFAPFAFVTLLGKIFAPNKWNGSVSKLKNDFDGNVTTRVVSSLETVPDPVKPSENNQLETDLQKGFTIEEQTNIVAAFLQNNGLLSGFAHFVVTMGHYSRNQNNPHAAAYGCGACGGKFSGPNGRVFAAMANHPEVRAALTEQDIHIPDDCWFIGAEHDTCNEAIQLDDTDLIPDNLKDDFKKLESEMLLAAKHSAHERCRKLASAPRNPDLETASHHISGRAVDFSQARPELGHATIASGFVGRRHLSQGTFMDRRCFLISYDSNVDPEGTFLERILLSAGPVGAGINLEYYFSSVNNDKYGCGSKIVHNLAGLFGVMEGSAGDLRTGLPKQMIEIHEPMRLQLMVEAKTEVLTAIYQRQPSIRQLVGNGWLLLSTKDPDSEQIHTFDPEHGWKLWEDSLQSQHQKVKQSSDWYRGHYDHLSPTLLAKNDDDLTTIKEKR